MSVLACENLCFSYGASPILKSLSLRLELGKLYGLIGANGSGKSTFFKCCVNFLKPHSGEILISGESILKKSPAWMAKHVSYVPQESGMATFPFSALDIVLMGRTPHLGGVFGPSARDYEVARESMARIGILGLLDYSVSELSGGQRQLLMIARALAQESVLMILDEPTSALDFKNQIVLWRVLRQIADSGTSVIVCSHDPNHVLWFCDEVIAFANGRLLAQGAPKQVMGHELINEVYGEECELHALHSTHFVSPKM
ncbi:MAG: ABC transporter ATP-binding protein [Wolinella sp.]